MKNKRRYFIFSSFSYTENPQPEYLGINCSVVNTWKSRKTDPPSRYIKRICDFLDVGIEWLITEEQKPDLNNLTGNEKELQQHFQKLSEQERIKFIGLGRGGCYFFLLSRYINAVITTNNRVKTSIVFMASPSYVPGGHQKRIHFWNYEPGDGDFCFAETIPFAAKNKN